MFSFYQMFDKHLEKKHLKLQGVFMGNSPIRKILMKIMQKIADFGVNIHSI